jgi:hypothetical protein
MPYIGLAGTLFNFPVFNQAPADSFIERGSIFYVVLAGFLPLKMMKIAERPVVHGALGGGEGARGEGRREAGADGASFATVFAHVLLAFCSRFCSLFWGQRPVWNHSWRIVVPAGVLLLSGCFMQFLRPLLMQQILLVVENDPDNPPVIAREYSPLCTPNMYPHFTLNHP